MVLMRLDRIQKIPLKKQRGSMLVIALFVIIIMALLGLTMVRLLSASADAVIHEVYGVRALNAAQSSLEISIQRAFPATQDGASVCSASSFLFTNTQGLENCSAFTSCTLITGFEDETVSYYRFESTGLCSQGKVTASRTVAVDAILE